MNIPCTYPISHIWAPPPQAPCHRLLRPVAWSLIRSHGAAQPVGETPDANAWRPRPGLSGREARHIGALARSLIGPRLSADPSAPKV